MAGVDESRGAAIPPSESAFAAALGEVGPTLPGVLFRYLWHNDGTDAIWYMSPGSTELFELDPREAEVDPGRLWAMIHPDDIPAMQASIAESARTLSPWRHEWRITTPSGVRKWVQGNGKPSRWPGGGVVWTSLLIDITEKREAGRRLEVSESRLRALLERIDAIAVQGYDRERRVFLWNAASERLYGWSHDEAIGRRLEDLIIPDAMRESVMAAVDGWLSGGVPIPSDELVLRHRDGRPVEVFSSHAKLENIDGEPEMYCIDIDIAERRRAVDALRRSEARLSQVLDLTGEGIWDWELDTGVVHHNARWAELLGLPTTALAHSPATYQAHLHPADRDRVMRALQASFDEGIDFGCEYRMLRADGSEIWVEDLGRVVERDPTGRPLRMLGRMTDVTSRRHAEQRAQFLAFFDGLTGLPNRQLLEERLDRALQACEASGRHGALVMLDLDDFRGVNDTHGHAVGDRLLQAVAQRLGGLVAGSDTLARPGGDEFLLLLPDLGDSPVDAAQAARSVAQRLKQALDTPVELDGIMLPAAASFGIAVFPSAGGAVVDVLREADTALYQAKGEGTNHVGLYDAAMGGQVSARMRLDMDLRHAVERGEFELHAQSEVDSSGRVAGAELLLRWRHPERGLLAPGEFIEAAERSGAILAIGDWVLAEGCRAVARLTREGHALPLSLNVSPLQFRQPDFVERVRGHLASSGADPHRVILEVTENLLIDDVEQAAMRMRELSELGLRFSIDDFGTGFSSLAYLKRLPLYQLKIDRSFIQDTPGDASDCAIVRLVISMASSLGLTVVAEGVETREQAAFLRGTGCDLQQGWLYARAQPLPTWFEGLGGRRASP